MKNGILLAILISSFTVNAQSLKDALYSGKLKTDTGTVIRKGDDLSSKIDTSRKKPVDQEKRKLSAISGDSSIAGLISPTDSLAAVTAGPKDNNKIWKEYIDSLTSTLKAEVFPSKKIKEGTYYVLVEYEIGPDGQITINNISSTPESSFLQQQIKERLTLTAPQMNPLMSNNGKPRKIVKKYTLILSKA